MIFLFFDIFSGNSNSYVLYELLVKGKSHLLMHCCQSGFLAQTSASTFPTVSSCQNQDLKITSYLVISQNKQTMKQHCCLVLEWVYLAKIKPEWVYSPTSTTKKRLLILQPPNTCCNSQWVPGRANGNRPGSRMAFSGVREKYLCTSLMEFLLSHLFGSLVFDLISGFDRWGKGLLILHHPRLEVWL